MPAIFAMSASVSSRWTRSISVPSLRASMKSVSPRRSRKRAVVLVAREEPEADGDLRGVEELAGQGDHAVHEVGLDDGLADLAFAGLVGGHAAVGEDEAGEAGGREVVDEVLHPGEVGVARGRDAVLPAHVVLQQLAAPVGVVEGRIGEDVVGLEVGVEVAAEGVGVAPMSASMPRMARFIMARRQVVGLRLLAVDAMSPMLPAVGLDEFLGLHEHAAGAAAGVVDAAFVGREHLDEHAHDARRACRTGRRSCPRRWRTG